MCCYCCYYHYLFLCYVLEFSYLLRKSFDFHSCGLKYTFFFCNNSYWLVTKQEIIRQLKEVHRSLVNENAQHLCERRDQNPVDVNVVRDLRKEQTKVKKVYRFDTGFVIYHLEEIFHYLLEKCTKKVLKLECVL